MQLSATMCRAQEARQLALAATAPLTNVRGVATLAAAAWAKEALAADKREKRMALVEAARADARAALHASAPSREDRALSENPDRAFADPGHRPGQIALPRD